MGCFGVPRCHETAGNKEKQGERDKDIEKEETKNATKTATILWRFLLAIFDYKTGDFLRFWPFLRPPNRGYSRIFLFFFTCRRTSVLDHNRKKTLGKAFLAFGRTFQAGGRYKNPCKTPEKPCLPLNSFPLCQCAPYFFWPRKVHHRSRVVYHPGRNYYKIIP